MQSHFRKSLGEFCTSQGQWLVALAAGPYCVETVLTFRLLVLASMVQSAVVPAFRSQLFLQPLLELAAGHKSTSSFCWSMDACACASAMFHSTVCTFASVKLCCRPPREFLCSCFFWCSLSHRIGETDPETLSSSAQYLIPFAPHEIIFSPSLLTLEDIVQASPHNLLGVSSFCSPLHFW